MHFPEVQIEHGQPRSFVRIFKFQRAGKYAFLGSGKAFQRSRRHRRAPETIQQLPNYCSEHLGNIIHLFIVQVASEIVPTWDNTRMILSQCMWRRDAPILVTLLSFEDFCLCRKLNGCGSCVCFIDRIVLNLQTAGFDFLFRLHEHLIYALRSFRHPGSVISAIPLG